MSHLMRESQMSIGRTIRSIGWASLTGIGLAVLALPSAAAEHRMSPFVTVGPQAQPAQAGGAAPQQALFTCQLGFFEDRKSTRLNSSHVEISYAGFCLKKKKTNYDNWDH